MSKKQEDDRKKLLETLDDIEQRLNNTLATYSDAEEKLIKILAEAITKRDTEIAEKTSRIISELHGAGSTVKAIRDTLKYMEAYPIITKNSIMFAIPVPYSFDVEEIEKALWVVTGDIWLPKRIDITTITLIAFRKAGSTRTADIGLDRIMKLLYKLSKMKEALKQYGFLEESDMDESQGH